MKRIGYLGPRGTFTEEALNSYVDSHDLAVETIPEQTIVSLFKGFEIGDFDLVIVPIENSVEGSVTTSLDQMVQSPDAVIIAEIVIPIHHYLLANTEGPADEVTDIFSHSQAIAQCQEYLAEHCPNAVIHSTTSTAQAAQEVAGLTGERRAAAIGNRALSDLYGLRIVAERINDFPNNTTRFVLLSRDASAPTGSDKTSLVFSAKKDQPGSLHTVLGEFASRGINLTRISSRPTKSVLGEYLFFIDFLGHKDDPEIKAAISDIQARASFFKWLGSYPINQSPVEV